MDLTSSSWEYREFPNGEMTYYFEYKYKSDLSTSFVQFRRVDFINQLSEIKPKLHSSESGAAEIGASESTKISFWLSNPTSFQQNLTSMAAFRTQMDYKWTVW